jgi:hypothetical protein
MARVSRAIEQRVIKQLRWRLVTTPLVRPLTREILVGGSAYKLVIAADRLVLTPKGRRKGVEVTWDQLLVFHERASEPPALAASKPSVAGVSRSILNEIALALRTATSSLSKADDTLTQAGVLPAELRAELRPDPLYGPGEDRSDWFVEPLLTDREVASILRVSTRALRRLALRSILVAGETRYRQSEIREFLRKQESRIR